MKITFHQRNLQKSAIWGETILRIVEQSWRTQPRWKWSFVIKLYFFSGQTLDSDAPKKYMRENGNILVWCDLMPRVNLMYCITIKNGVVIYSWGSSIYIYIFVALVGETSPFSNRKKMTEGEWKTTYFLLHAELFSTKFL